MNIYILCIGKLKESYWRDALAEYLKRLRPYCRPAVIECKESERTKHEGTEAAGIEEEGQELLAKIRPDMYVITLEIKGKRLSSPAFAEKIKSLALTGKSDLCFVIGGSLGLSSAVSDRADDRLSFSDMTFPHQLMRVILAEQVYRAFKINRGETYHK